MWAWRVCRHTNKHLAADMLRRAMDARYHLVCTVTGIYIYAGNMGSASRQKGQAAFVRSRETDIIVHNSTHRTTLNRAAAGIAQPVAPFIELIMYILWSRHQSCQHSLRGGLLATRYQKLLQYELYYYYCTHDSPKRLLLLTVGNLYFDPRSYYPWTKKRCWQGSGEPGRAPVFFSKPAAFFDQLSAVETSPFCQRYQLPPPGRGPRRCLY